MNEQLHQADAMYQSGLIQPDRVMAKVVERMLETRPRQSIRFRPFYESFARQQTSFGPYQIDFAACWPDAPEGAVAYAAAKFQADIEQEVVLTVKGSTKWWFNGKLHEGAQSLKIRMRNGWNELLLQGKREQGWIIEVLIGFPRYPGMWAKDYLFSTRPTFPQALLQGEEGIAYMGPFIPGESSRQELERVERTALAGNYDAWEPTIQVEEEYAVADLMRMYGREAYCAYSLSYYDMQEESTAVLEAEHVGAVVIWNNNKEIYRSAQSGKARLQLPTTEVSRQGTILIKSVRCDQGAWGLQVRITGATSGQRLDQIPFLETNRSCGVRWLFVGPFGNAGETPEQLLNRSFEVENDVRFHQPYSTGQGDERVFWRLSLPDTYMRPYLDGFFFGQWFYAIQVGLYGMLQAAEELDATEISEYARDSMLIMATYHEYALWDAKRFGVPTLIPRAQKLEELDPCGMPGLMFSELYERTKHEEIVPVLRRLTRVVMNEVPRMEDGTFYRIDTMWADDFFMSCPFLARLGRMNNDSRYYEEIIRQAQGFHKRLWMPDKQLYAHIYFPENDVHNSVPWGRGNGWILFGLTEVLLQLPTDAPDRDCLLHMLQNLARGIAACQDASGLWHQVLDVSASYPETSCTAMFVLSLARCIRMRWISEDLSSVVYKGWKGLLKHSMDAEGNIYGVCLGSGCSMDVSYYEAIPTYLNDDHGTGIVLLAAKEVQELTRWKNEIAMRGNKPNE